MSEERKMITEEIDEIDLYKLAGTKEEVLSVIEDLFSERERYSNLRIKCATRGCDCYDSDSYGDYQELYLIGDRLETEKEQGRRLKWERLKKEKEEQQAKQAAEKKAKEKEKKEQSEKKELARLLKKYGTPDTGNI